MVQWLAVSFSDLHLGFHVVDLDLISTTKWIFFSIPLPLELLPVLGPLERYMTPTLDVALICSSRAGSYLGRKSDGLRSFVNWVHT